MNKQKGITLIALIVTIIVLIILAGISINLILGENGIIAKAQKAAEEQRISNLQEEVAMKMSEREIDIKTGIAKEVEEYLNKIQGAKTTKIKEDTWYVEKNEVTVTVYEDGDIVRERVEIWDGSSEVPEIKDGNWYIYNAKQLKFLADYVNSTNVEKQSEMIQQAGYEESDLIIDSTTTIYLMEYIDLGAREINGKWENETNEALEWEAIGKSTNLQAVFEGNGKTIRGAYINTDTNYNGIFGKAKSIKNLTIKNGYIKGASGTAGIVGMLSGIVENCHNINTSIIVIAGSYTGGGIIGQANEGSKILNCTNTGEVVSIAEENDPNSLIAGIVGFALDNAEIINCHNTGIITGNKKFVAGIVGFAYQESNIKNCTNKGNITGYGESVGGIAGWVNPSSIIDNCYNEATIMGTDLDTGGIAARIGKLVTIINCVNNGRVIGEGGYAGGITAYIGNSAKIENCYNTGKITGKEFIAGIVGGSNPSSTINNCFNTGEVVGEVRYTGGIIGSSNKTLTVTNCYNIGIVTSNGMYTGGIVGETPTETTISNCYNIGDVTGNKQCTGGIVGWLSDDEGANNSKVQKCYNAGSVNGKEDTGGIVGCISGTSKGTTIIECYNKGKVKGTQTIGAIVGREEDTAGINTFNKLYYLNTVGIGAINGVDNEENEVMATTENITSYEQFLEWIEK